MKNRWAGLVFLGWATLSFGVTLGRVAQANPTRRLPATACTLSTYGHVNSTPYFSPNLTFAVEGAVRGGRVLNDPAVPDPNQVFCPITSEISTGVVSTSTGVQRELITALAVDGYDASNNTSIDGQFIVHSCIVFGPGTDASCSAVETINGSNAAYTGQITNFVTNTTLAPLQDTSGIREYWYGTVVVTLPYYSTFVGLFFG